MEFLKIGIIFLDTLYVYYVKPLISTLEILCETLL